MRVTPKQSVPFFFSDKLLLLPNHLKRRLALPTLNASEQFVTACDEVFFKTLFYSGDWVGDLGQVKTADIALFPVTVVFSLITSGGKTLQDRASNLFGLRRHPKSACCPVRAIEEYVLPLHEDWVLVSPIRLTNQKG